MVRPFTTIAVSREHAEQRSNWEMEISLRYERGIMLFPIFARVILPLAEKVHHCHQLPIPSCSLQENPESHVEG